MSAPAVDLTTATPDEVRDHNRAVVADYMSRRDEGRRDRYLLFTEDGSAGLYTADTTEPVISTGHEALEAHGRWSLTVLPDWVWTNVQIFDTQDPERFWVECDGEGSILFPGYEPGWYTNHFIHSFEFENGRIKREREFMNPFNQLRSLGIPVPTVRREGFPVD